MNNSIRTYEEKNSLRSDSFDSKSRNTNSLRSNSLSLSKKEVRRKLRKESAKKTKHVILLVVVIVGFLLTIYKVNEVRTRAYAVYFGEKNIGIVRGKEEVSGLVDKFQREISDTYDIDAVIKEKLDFKETHAKDTELSTVKELKENIKSKLTFLVNGYVILADGRELGVLKTKEEAEEVIDRFKEPYIEKEEEDKKESQNTEVKEMKILENVDILKKDVAFSKIKNVEDVLKFIQTGDEKTETHIVEAGESLTTISRAYEVDLEDIIEANPDLEPDKVYPGDEINLKVPNPMLTVATVEEIKHVEDIDYETKVEKDDSMYKTEKKVKAKGSLGKNEILERIIKHNGKIVKKEVLAENVIEKPVEEVVVKGTKEVPKTVATGAFAVPTRGRVSSGYGPRGGRFHYGLDIAAPIGTPITAADGGTVTYAGWRGAYGKLVEINHGNGYVTRYGHCSEIYVSTGQKVYKGQKIAAVGSTGRSTGPHVHFEVIKNGQHVNPSGYL